LIAKEVSKKKGEGRDDDTHVKGLSCETNLRKLDDRRCRKG